MKHVTWGALIAAGALVVGCGAGSKSDYGKTAPSDQQRQPSGAQNLQPGIGESSNGLAIPAPQGTGGSGGAGQQGSAFGGQSGTSSQPSRVTGQSGALGQENAPALQQPNVASPSRAGAAGHRGTPGATERSGAKSAGGQSQEPGGNLPPGGSF